MIRDQRMDGEIAGRCVGVLYSSAESSSLERVSLFALFCLLHICLSPLSSCLERLRLQARS